MQIIFYFYVFNYLPNKLEDEEEFRDLYEDIRDECSKYGRVMSLAIPRKDQNGSNTPGMGNAYVEFYTIEESKEARRVN